MMKPFLRPVIKPLLLGTALLAIALVGRTAPATLPTYAQSDRVTLTYHECIDGPRYPLDRQVDCATLAVPENRDRPDSRLIELEVMIVRARQTPAQPDPLVYLSGGPGGSTTGLISSFEYIFGTFALARDVILMDQRGTGLSRPSLACPDYSLANFEAYVGGYSLEDGAQHAADAIIACYNDYAAQGVDMNAYTSAENAADFEDLRRALNIEQWNLYGISYGTRLALTIMRDYPDGIRSVIIDSVLPPNAELYIETPINGATALEGLFELCAADRACNTAYPDLRNTFYTLVDTYNANPETVEVRRPADGKYYNAILNGDTLIGATFWNMYSTRSIENLPYVIQMAADGFIGPLRQDYLPAYFAWESIATGMHYSVNCNEEIAFDTLTEIEAASDSLDARLQFFYDVDNYITYYICQEWNAGPPDPIEAAPVVSDIPTLILTGALDPITPPRWGALTAETLSNAHVFTVPNAGHGVTFAFECPRDFMRWFLTDPLAQLDTSCLQEIAAPTFYID